MPSSLSLDAPSIQALAAAFLPEGEITVENGHLFYRVPTVGLTISLDRLSAGATVDKDRLSISIQSLEMEGGQLSAKFSIKQRDHSA